MCHENLKEGWTDYRLWNYGKIPRKESESLVGGTTQLDRIETRVVELDFKLNIENYQINVLTKKNLSKDVIGKF